jgi:Glycosyltransferase sugar-binding region containing DXD motif
MSDLLSPPPPSLRIGQYWDTENTPGYIEDLFGTFRVHNPDFNHLIFSEAGTERFIAEHFGPRELAAFRACAVPSMQSDYFRYCFGLALGGVYADADYRCVRPLRPLLDRLEEGEIFLGRAERPLNGRRMRLVWSGFFAFRQPGHPFLRLALDIATANLEARIPEQVWPVGEMVVESIWLTVGPGVPTLMRFIYEWGSLDAFVEGVKGSPAEPFAELYCEVIGDYQRIVEAFKGVRVSPYETMMTWIGKPEFPLPYKQTDVDWHNVKTAIFR